MEKIMGLPYGTGNALAMRCLGIVTPQVHQVTVVTEMVYVSG